ncbi:MAG: NAD(P)-dependent oxidoreductase [Acidobacteriaceae bacterium]
MAQRPLPIADLEHVLQHTAHLWEEMRGRQIFITGGTGFFGCWLLETFCHINRRLALNARVTVLTRSPLAFAAKAPHLVSDASVVMLKGDVRNFSFPSGNFPFVIHAATEASARQAAEAPLEMLTTILAGTQRTLEFAAGHGTARFLLTSSGAVYGRQPQEVEHISESYMGAPDPLDPSNVYSEGKRASELMCALYSKNSGLECIIARCWAFCGPHLPLDAHFAIGNFIGDVLSGLPIQIKGDGTSRRSYLYGSDLAIWLWTMLFRAPSLVPINVGSANDLSILELAQTVAAVLNPRAAIHVGNQFSSATSFTRYVPSVKRAGELLGLAETVDLAESISRTAAWYQNESEEG